MKRSLLKLFILGFAFSAHAQARPELSRDLIKKHKLKPLRLTENSPKVLPYENCIVDSELVEFPDDDLYEVTNPTVIFGSSASENTDAAFLFCYSKSQRTAFKVAVNLDSVSIGPQYGITTDFTHSIKIHLHNHKKLGDFFGTYRGIQASFGILVSGEASLLMHKGIVITTKAASTAMSLVTVGSAVKQLKIHARVPTPKEKIRDRQLLVEFQQQKIDAEIKQNFEQLTLAEIQALHATQRELLPKQEDAFFLYSIDEDGEPNYDPKNFNDYTFQKVN